jgi:hypothetical protein
MRGAATVALFSIVTACRGASPPSQPQPDSWRATTLAELFPEDLDFVVRIDATRIRENPLLSGVVHDIGKASGSELLGSAKTAFDDAKTVWVGTRWMSDGFHGDGVLAIERDPPRGAEAHRMDAQRVAARSDVRRLSVPYPDVEVFERQASARGEAVLEVVMIGRGFVLATAAEADAVLRVVRSRPDEERLDPPARGLVSFAGRMRKGGSFADDRAGGAFRKLAEGLVDYAGSLDERDGIEVEASLTYVSPAAALRAAERAREAVTNFAAAGGHFKTMADSVKLTELDSSLRVRATLPFAWLSQLH